MNILVMGVAGTGKSTIASGLAERLGAVFLEADDFHPESNRAKMASGVPLTDADREPWIEALCDAIRAHTPGGGSVSLPHESAGVRGSGTLPPPDGGVRGGCVVACSGLRRSHRDRLRASGIERALWLTGDAAVIRARLVAREAEGHFMKASMLDSQLAALEAPGPDEPVTVLDVTLTPEEIVERAVAAVRTP